MNDVKTVDTVKETTVVSNPVCRKQKETVDKMRAAVLACSADDPTSTRQAMQSITAMRIYHQMTRIVNYLDLMDKLEAKLYDSILTSIDSADSAEPETFLMLMGIQTKLQKNMIESHKLLEPYLEVQEFTNAVDLAASSTETTESDSMSIMSSEVRDNLRANAKKVLEMLDTVSGDDPNG